MTRNAFSTRVIAPADWPDLAIRFCDLGFEQTRTYAEAAAQRIGGHVRFIAIQDCDGHVVAAAAIRIRNIPGLGRGIAWCPAGPLLLRDGKSCDPVPVLLALREHLALTQGHVLRLRLSGTAFADDALWTTAAHEAGFKAVPAYRSYRSAAIDLSLADQDLIRQFDGKWRTDLRFSQKSGLELESGTSEQYKARFLALFAEVQGTKGFQPDIRPEFHFALSGQDYACEILIATQQGQDVAAIVVGHAGPCSTYLFGATGVNGRPVRAGYFLTWEALQRSRSRGARWYDLGGIDPADNPDVARFKLRMNGSALGSDVWETNSGRLVPRLVLGLERLRSRWKAR